MAELPYRTVVGLEVLARCGGATPVPATVEDDEPEAFGGEGALALPLLRARGQGAVDEDDGGAVAPRLDVELSRVLRRGGWSNEWSW